MLRASAVLLFLLSFTTITFAQTGIVTEPDSLLLRESQDILVRNVTEETVRIDSLRFSQHTANGWYLGISDAGVPSDYESESLYYVGSLYFWQTFPLIELVAGDTAWIRIGHLDRCVYCKAGGIGEYVEIDTLFIFTDIGGADPHQVILNFEEFMVSIEDEPPTTGCLVRGLSIARVRIRQRVHSTAGAGLGLHPGVRYSGEGGLAIGKCCGFLPAARCEP
jgi:hypothetical protein